MNAPDSVSPIIGFRAWRWNASGLTSLSGESWRPQCPLEAQCEKFPNPHHAPQAGCPCGIYASKNLDELSRHGWFGLYCAFDGSAAVQMYREKGPYDVV